MNAHSTKLAAAIAPPKSRMKGMMNGWNAVGLVLLTATLGISLWRVTSTEKQLYTDDVAVVRISHWQLELGYRQALQRLMDDYNAMQDERFKRGEIKKRVKVIQLPVSEKTYAQLINTNLIAHTAPDIIEMGFSRMVSGGYKAEYFVNISSLAELPNPYNAEQYLSPELDADTKRALPVMPWRDTFLDGMIGGFDRDLQGYYGVCTTFAPGGRLAVNVDMLKAATGSEDLPQTLGQLLDACAKLRAWGKANGREVWPIAATRYNTNNWTSMIAPFLRESQRAVDADRDGSVNMHEFLTASQKGVWSFSDPAMADLVAATRALSAEFPNGFTAMDRDAAMFLFTQQQSAFFQCGAWDAGTVYRLAEGKFKVKIMGSVMPGKGEKWGPKHPVNEAAMTAACSYGLYKLSPNLDVAIDFLRYWTSQAQNQRFNQEADWVPCIVGTRLTEGMKAFTPRIEGIYGGSAWLPTWEGEAIRLTLEGQMLGVQTGEITHEKMAAKMAEAIADADYGAPKVFQRSDELSRDQLRASERSIGTQALLRLLAPDKAGSENNYRAVVSTQSQGLNGMVNEAMRRCAERELPKAGAATTDGGSK
ncbi:MAG: extracellular solute-binding protein [Planctomycetes bacterium]|nr:extracellular solute-binding protein [Planctomycetota bacterium]